MREGHDEWPQTLYLRASEVHDRDRVIAPSWGGRCVLLTDEGCLLPLDERPTGCRLLDPDTCHASEVNDKERAALQWVPYQDLLIEARILADAI